MVSPVSAIGYLKANNTSKIVTPNVIKALLSPDIRRNPNKTIRRKTGVAAKKSCKTEKLEAGTSTFNNTEEISIKSILGELEVNFCSLKLMDILSV